MAYIVHKDQSDTVERLPYIAETPIWQDFDCATPSKPTVLAALLYSAVADRENYFQDNTPTPFGNPKYAYLSGLVNGIKMAAGIEEETADGRLIFRKGKRKVLEVDKVRRPAFYYEAVKDNAETLRAIGL